MRNGQIQRGIPEGLVENIILAVISVFDGGGFFLRYLFFRNRRPKLCQVVLSRLPRHIPIDVEEGVLEAGIENAGFFPNHQCALTS